ncbi:hypothetical protein ACE4Z7_25295, partial [Salmonella enterica]|uniref:hypothetical protein n=1 Tax=Salmonella enterica TaxID=28901 RepID=UPI003D2D5A23
AALAAPAPRLVLRGPIAGRLRRFGPAKAGWLLAARLGGSLLGAPLVVAVAVAAAGSRDGASLAGGLLAAVALATAAAAPA